MEAGLSIVVPLYNEARGLARLHAQLSDVARALARQARPCGRSRLRRRRQPRRHAEVARGLPAEALDVQVVSLSRNFGKEAALAAGLDHARRGAVLFMDGDGQHPPALIETLVGHWLDDGYDVVYTAKAHRENESVAAPPRRTDVLRAAQLGRAPQDPRGRRRFPPALAARRRCAAPHAGAQPLLQGAGELDRLPADARRLRAGRARCTAQTAFGWGSLLGLSIEGLTSFSVAPLRLASLLGLLLALSALVFGASMLFEVVVYGVSVPGYPSVVVGLMVLGGVQLMMIGVLGEYIGKILSELKARPVYFVAEHSVKAGRERRRAARDAHRRRVRAMNETTARRIWLCADDYGISPGVNAAIRDLVARGRLNATSVMVVAPSFSRAEAVALDMLNAAGARVAIGLHLTLTGAVQAAERRLCAAARRRVPAAHDHAAARRAAAPRHGGARGRDRARSSRRSRKRSAARRISSTAISTCICFRRCATPRSRRSRWMAPHAWVRQCGSDPAAARGGCPIRRAC